MALGWPCHTLLLWSVCSRSRNCCQCTRILQHVTLPWDTVENPSSKRLVVCWRLRQRQSISSCWHSPAFVHHIWPRWKLSRAQVSFPTCPSTMPAWQPGHCHVPGAGHEAAPRCGHQGGTPWQCRGCRGARLGGGGTGPERAHTAVPRGHWHVGYCHGSCDSGECGVDASGLLAAPPGPRKRQNTSGALPGLTSARRWALLGAEGAHRSGERSEDSASGQDPSCHPKGQGSPQPSVPGRLAGGWGAHRALPGAPTPWQG